MSGCPQVVASIKMGPEGVAMSASVGAALQIYGRILKLCRNMGRAAEIAADAVSTPVTNDAGEARELRACRHLLMWLASWWTGLYASIP